MERSLGYRPGLDGVRALAIGLVLLNHTGLSIFLGGGNGVIVFFVWAVMPHGGDPPLRR